jgi:hypothetical protein
MEPTGHQERRIRCRVCVNVPAEEALIERILDAAWQAGAGRFGSYSRVAFVARGSETFMIEAGARPYQRPARGEEVGTVTVRETAQVQMQCDLADLAAVVRAIRDEHPYEVPVIEAWRLENPNTEEVGISIEPG